MRRRNFVGLSAAVLAWPRLAIAAELGLPTIGFLSLAAADAFAHLLKAFHKGLGEAGYVQGENVAIDYRWAAGDYDRLHEFAKELVERNVALIVSSGGDRPTIAAKAATATIPIVFVGSDDPIGLGFVKSLSHPGGNLTGGSLFTSELEVKKLELLSEAAPSATRIGMLANPVNPAAERDIVDVTNAARAGGSELFVARASDALGIDAAFAEFEAQKLDAMLLGHDPFFNSQREQIVAHVTRLSIVAIYEHREFVRAGGLMSYGNDIAENYRLAGLYVARILKGAKPAELPVQQAKKFELILNLAAASALGFEFPPSLLVRADEVIE